MSLFQRLFIDQRFDAWVSDNSLVAARILNQAAADLILLAEEDLKAARWKDGLVDTNAFLNDKLAPRVREVAEPLALMIIEEANYSLKAIVDTQAIWTRNAEMVASDGNAFEAAGDIAAAVIPFGAGAAAAAALPFAAVTTTTAFFGLVSTTAISWPLVLGGGALAGLGIVTGALEGSKLWSKVEARLRRKSRSFIVSALLKGSDAHPSILEQLIAEFERTAERARAAA